jgi:hypothetical protein
MRLNLEQIFRRAQLFFAIARHESENKRHRSSLSDARELNQCITDRLCSNIERVRECIRVCERVRDIRIVCKEQL